MSKGKFTDWFRLSYLLNVWGESQVVRCLFLFVLSVFADWILHSVGFVSSLKGGNKHYLSTIFRMFWIFTKPAYDPHGLVQIINMFVFWFVELQFNLCSNTFCCIKWQLLSRTFNIIVGFRTRILPRNFFYVMIVRRFSLGRAIFTISAHGTYIFHIHFKPKPITIKWVKLNKINCKLRAAYLNYIIHLT